MSVNSFLNEVTLSYIYITASNDVIRNIYNMTKMSTKDSHFRRMWGKFIQISFDASTVVFVR